MERLAQQPSAAEIISNYLDRLAPEEHVVAANLAAEFLQTDKPLANTIVLIPVAAHQEASNVYPALSQYARQQTDQPFSVLLHPNFPKNADMAAVEATQAQIAAAQADFPALDIRTGQPLRYDNPTIGAVRADLWNACLIIAQQTGNLDGPAPMIGVNHDIDTDSIGRQYLRQVHRYYTNYDPMPHLLPGGLPPANTRVRHTLPSSHPNIARLLFWYDLSYDYEASGYDAGTTIPLALYAGLGGFDRQAVIAEVLGLVKPYEYLCEMIPTTMIKTSPRRYVWRLAEGADYIWSEETFGPNDACRESLTVPDISENDLQEHLLDRLPQTMGSTWHSAIVNQVNEGYKFDSAPSPELVLEHVIKRTERVASRALHTARRALGMIAASPEVLADFDAHYIPQKYVDRVRSQASRTLFHLYAMEDFKRHNEADGPVEISTQWLS